MLFIFVQIVATTTTIRGSLRQKLHYDPRSYPFVSLLEVTISFLPTENDGWRFQNGVVLDKTIRILSQKSFCADLQFAQWFI